MVSFQKKLASKILKVGLDKIWIDKTKLKEVEKAITRKDIKNLIKKGYIRKIIEKKPYPFKKEKKRVRKGGKYSIISKKERWVSMVRALRSYLNELREQEKIDKQTYKKVYRWIKGGMFRSKAHLRIFLKQRGLLKKNGES